MRQCQFEITDFKELINSENYYVDKTLLIGELLDNDGNKIIFTRPGGYGKTINSSMLYYFFSNREESRELFSNLEVGMALDGKYLKYLNKYPFIYMSFKDCSNFNSYEEFLEKISVKISNLFKKHCYLLKEFKLMDDELKKFNEVLNGECNNLDNCFMFLVTLLNKYYKQNVFVVLEDYDRVIIQSLVYKCFSKVMGDINTLFNSLINCSFLKYFIVTAVVRCGDLECINDFKKMHRFDINKIAYSKYFGYSYSELEKLLMYYGKNSSVISVNEWCGNYLIGELLTCNPRYFLLHIYKKDEITKEDESFFKKIIYLFQMSGVDTSISLEDEIFIKNDFYGDFVLPAVFSSSDYFKYFLLTLGVLTKVDYTPLKKSVEVTLSNSSLRAYLSLDHIFL